MKCILLCAGYATRLYPLTLHQPKSLLPIGNQPLLNYIVDDVLSISSIEEIILVSNHRFFDQFLTWKETFYPTANIHILDDGSVTNEMRLGAIKDLRFAISAKKVEDDVLVLAGDNLFDFSLKGFVDTFRHDGKDLIMIHPEPDIENLKKTGVAELNGDRVVGFEEKPPVPKSQWAVPPFYLYSKETLNLFSEYLDEGNPSDAPGNFIAWLCQKKEVRAFPMQGHRYDIGDAESYDFVSKLFEKK
jgi:glucose-1-phosphate thymidylyltransferase